MGFPISIKLKDGGYVLICSSEAINNEDLIWMNNITNSSLSIVINSERMKYITEKDFEEDLYVKVRSTGRLIKAKIEINNTLAKVDLLEEEQGIAPGQACVFYLKNNHFETLKNSCPYLENKTEPGSIYLRVN